MRIDLNNGWLWTDSFSADMTQRVYKDEDKMQEVRIPHAVKITPLSHFDEHIYQMYPATARHLTFLQSGRERRYL